MILPSSSLGAKSLPMQQCPEKLGKTQKSESRPDEKKALCAPQNDVVAPFSPSEPSLSPASPVDSGAFTNLPKRLILLESLGKTEKVVGRLRSNFILLFNECNETKVSIDLTLALRMFFLHPFTVAAVFGVARFRVSNTACTACKMCTLPTRNTIPIACPLVGYHACHCTRPLSPHSLLSCRALHPFSHLSHTCGLGST